MSDRAPTVGVLVPVRNGAATIHAAISSLLSQTPRVDRVVVVDGGSDDGTLDRIPDDPRVEVVRQRSRGLGAGRNEGIDRLRTELVGFCDADDRWTPGSLAARRDVLIEHPELVAVAGSVRLTTTPGAVLPSHRTGTSGAVLPGYTPGAVLVRRSSVGRFDESLAIASDTDWLGRLVDTGGLRLIDAVVLEKGLGAETLSADVAAYRSELLSVVRQMVARRRRG